MGEKAVCFPPFMISIVRGGRGGRGGADFILTI